MTAPCTRKVLGNQLRRLLLVDEDDDRRSIIAAVENLQQSLPGKNVELGSIRGSR